jgi:hypothetical protein
MLLPAVAAVLLLTVPVHAEIVSIERLLLPSEVAERIEGSGVLCNSVLTAGGAGYKLDIASLRFRVSSRLSLRGGLGMASLKLLAVSPEETTGVVIAGGVTATLWQAHGFALDVTGGALRASPPVRGLNEARLMVAFGTQ